MRVRSTKTGTVAEYCDGYAARLIEQGLAVPVSEAELPEAHEKPPEREAAGNLRGTAGDRKPKGRGRNTNVAERPRGK